MRGSRAVRSCAVTLLLCVVVGSCSTDRPDARHDDPTDVSSSATRPPSASASLVPLTHPALPPIRQIDALGGERIRASHTADWVTVTRGRAWVTGLGAGIGFFDARTGRREGSVSVPGEPCAAPAVGFGAIWTATCGTPRGVARIDPATGRVTGAVGVEIAQPESSLGAGEGAVWAIADGGSCSNCRVVRIDPQEVRVTARFPVPPGASAVRAGLGGVWVTYFGGDEVLRIDPADGSIAARIRVGDKPAFLDIGGGSVWVMGSADGALCRIDPTTDSVLSRAVLDPGGGYGDLTVGDGFVWWRGDQALVTQVDQRTGAVVARIGAGGVGDGSAAAGSGQLWISAHDIAALYRVGVPRS